jgi:hypothetical protein
MKPCEGLTQSPAPKLNEVKNSCEKKKCKRRSRHRESLLNRSFRFGLFPKTRKDGNVRWNGGTKPRKTKPIVQQCPPGRHWGPPPHMKGKDLYQAGVDV